MNTLEFLRHILPSEGWYVTTVIDAGAPPKQRSFEDVDHLASMVNALSDKGHNVYYAVASFTQSGTRKANAVSRIKAFFLDIDCGEDTEKKYATKKDGLLALGEFVKAANMPKPMVVSSGNGWHVYWVLDRELEIGEWKPIAENLKAACRKHGFRVDPAVPADAARVLRPIGTVNPKGGNEVKLAISAEPTTVEDMRQRLGTYGGVPARVQAISSTTKSRTTLIDKLAVRQDYPPANPDVIVAKCAQINWAVSNQKDVTEPMWYGLIGVAAFCTNPEDTAIAWSSEHPTYSESETIRKLDHWKQATTGPTTCAKFDSERPDVCKKCHFTGRIGSPARLGLQREEIEVAQTAPDPMAFEVPIPKPFKRTADGIKQVTDGTDVDVCKFDLYPVGYGYDETLGYEVVRYHWNRQHVGWKELRFRQAYLAQDNREFATAIADQGIVLSSKFQTASFQNMLRAYMDELRKIKAVTNLYSTMGWKENNTQFLIGDRIIRRDDSGSAVVEHINLAASSQRLGEKLFDVKGDVKQWSLFTSLIQKGNLPVHGFALGVAFSAPLYQFSGLRGVVISLCGPTGSGKSIAQLWMQSIYGIPDKLHFTAKYTQNAVFSRFGFYNNLPITIDEATMMPDKDVGDFCYWVTQGKDKARLNKNSEEKDAKTWGLPCVTSSNRSLGSKMMTSGMDTDAQLARLLEINMHPVSMFSDSSTAGKKIFDFLSNNHGSAGEVMLKYLVELGETGIRAMIDDHHERFFKKYNAKFTGQERFWEHGIVQADLGNEIAKKLDLIQYDYEAYTRHILNELGTLRETVRSNKMDAFDMLAAYLNDAAGDTITVMHTVGQTRPMVDNSRIPRSGIRVRIDAYRKAPSAPFTSGTLILDRKHFKQWVNTNHGDYNAIIKTFTVCGINATPKSDKFSIGKDCPVKPGQIYVVGVNLNHDRLRSILDDVDDTVDNMTLNQLQVIT
jgi:hypothetical protein